MAIQSCLVAVSLMFVAGCAQKETGQAVPVGSTVGVSSATAAQPGALLAVGSPAPNLSATAQTGEVVNLQQLSGKPVVVYFYPKDDTPGCTVEAQEIRDLWTDIKSTGAVVVGVSSDDAESHRAFAEKHALPFLLLADTDHALAKAFGVPLNNGRARRVSFVIGRDGRVAQVFPEVTPKGHGQELLQAVRNLPPQ